MGPHRHQEVVALCRVCKAPGDNRCRRCGRPLCGEHGPEDPTRRCRDCERVFRQKSKPLLHAALGRRVPGRTPLPIAVCAGILLLMASAGWIGASAAGDAVMSISLALVDAILVFLVARAEPTPGGARRRLRRARARFLAERSAE